MPPSKHDNKSLLHFDIDELVIQNQAILVTYGFFEALTSLSGVVIPLVFDIKNNKTSFQFLIISNVTL